MTVVISDSSRKAIVDLSKVRQINGTYHIRKHAEYGYTARLKYVCIIFNDGTTIDLDNFNRSKTYTGGGYDKVAEMLGKLIGMSALPTVHALDMYSPSAFGTHKFTITIVGKSVNIVERLTSEEIV